MEISICTGCDKEKNIDGFKRCERCREQRRKQYLKDKDKENEQSRAYHARNKEKINQRHIEYNIVHKEQIRSNRNKRYHNKLKKNKRYMLDGAFSKAIRKELKRRKLRKETTWESLVGYTLESLMTHLESKFDENMNWDNYGTYWHIDHIKPKSWFEYENTDDDAFRKCWALENLQPLEAKANISKGNRFEG